VGRKLKNKNKNMKSTKEVILHGEAMLFQSEIPASAKKIPASNGTFHIIANSETTGNHHVVDAFEGVDFYQDTDGRVFMKNEKTTSVRCVMTERHSPIELEPSNWEFGIQKEYDHFAQNLVNVRD
jgi:hypothetical protein